MPVASSFEKKILDKFKNIRKQKGKDYKPRTRHIDQSGWAKYTNRLFLETSPYLLQHAHNPVNWYPWGEEAFETAKSLNRPLFLSIGYSTCHWCHVMEEESFEDEEIARYLNENYISIKVDREERPDVDAIYMSAVQAMTGHGGWPMSVWLDHQRRPFHGGTYFPARDGDRGAPVGFLSILRQLKNAWDTQPHKISEVGESLIKAIREHLAATKADHGLPTTDVLDKAFEFYANRFDSQNGGMSGAPKFPSSMPVRFLLRYHKFSQNPAALSMSSTTLLGMARGGIYDHVAGGFHRYATDEIWLVPHFEKMLYDNALLALAYLEGYQATREKDFLRVVREILDYIVRDMTSNEGAFYSATDADSVNPLKGENHIEEGWFFTWNKEEINKALQPNQANAVFSLYNLTRHGNFEGRNIFYVDQTHSHVAKQLGISEDKLNTTIAKSKEKLYQARKKRPMPLRDEKILTAWNALMISAFARAGLVLNDNAYIAQAQKAAEFILQNLYIDGRLFRSYKDGKARFNAYLDDYAFFVAALLDLYEATGQVKWIKTAIELDEVLHKHYEDQKSGGFYMTSSDHEVLLARQKPGYDGAEPSGNSVAIMNLLRLHEFTTDDNYRKRIEQNFRAFSGDLKNQPMALAEMLLAVDYYLGSAKEIIIITPHSRSDADLFLKALNQKFVPNRILLVLSQNQVSEHEKIVPIVKSKIAIDGKTTAYVCQKGVCKHPVTDIEEFLKQI